MHIYACYVCTRMGGMGTWIPRETDSFDVYVYVCEYECMYVCTA